MTTIIRIPPQHPGDYELVDNGRTISAYTFIDPYTYTYVYERATGRYSGTYRRIPSIAARPALTFEFTTDFIPVGVSLRFAEQVKAYLQAKGEL